MSHTGFLSTLRSSDYDLIAALRFLDEYGRHVQEHMEQHKVYHHFNPRFDLEQFEDTYELYGELPGFRREDISIEAHDDHNLQVSGCIDHLNDQPPPPSQSRPSKDPVDPSVESLRENESKQAPKTKDSNDDHEAASSRQVPATAPDPLEATTTKHERYLNARFGDVLDPHATFIDEEPAAKPAAKPKVRYLISERHPSQFHRAFHFPTPIKKDEITATMENGILHITARRAPMPPPVKVQVKDVPSDMIFQW
jgi:HSP20 family molecular chaperone IbpA